MTNFDVIQVLPLNLFIQTYNRILSYYSFGLLASVVQGNLRGINNTPCYLDCYT